MSGTMQALQRVGVIDVPLLEDTPPDLPPHTTSSFASASSSVETHTPKNSPGLDENEFGTQYTSTSAPLHTTTTTTLFLFSTATRDMFFVLQLPKDGPDTQGVSFFMVDLLQNNSILHYYNANYGRNFAFVQRHASALLELIDGERERERDRDTEKRQKPEDVDE